MVNKGSYTGLFEGLELAVPRLGNVQLRFHFLRRGTSGQRILHSQANTTSITLPTIGLAKGIYMLHLATHSGTLVSKIIVQ